MINKDLNTRQLKYEFLKNGLVTIENWLDDDYAENLWDHLNTMPEDWWFISTRPTEDGGMTIVRNTPEKQSEIEYNKQVANFFFTQNHFSYVFRRTNDDHVDTCDCYECKFKKDAVSVEVKNFIKKITDFDVTKLNEFFASWYESGHFLSPHSDGPNGVLGFVYNLSKDWKPHYGGNLHFQSNNNENIIEKVNVPTFNTLTMFDLETTMGHMHYVSHVAPDITQKRLAFAGWWG